MFEYALKDQHQQIQNLFAKNDHMYCMSNSNLIGNHYRKTSFKGMMKHES